MKAASAPSILSRRKTNKQKKYHSQQKCLILCKDLCQYFGNLSNSVPKLILRYLDIYRCILQVTSVSFIRRLCECLYFFFFFTKNSNEINLWDGIFSKRKCTKLMWMLERQFTPTKYFPWDTLAPMPPSRRLRDRVPVGGRFRSLPPALFSDLSLHKELEVAVIFCPSIFFLHLGTCLLPFFFFSF